MPDPIHALRFAIQLAEAEGYPECAAGLRVALDRLAQPTDTQADLISAASPALVGMVSRAAPQGGGDAPRRHLTQDEVRIMDKALLASSTLIHAGELAGGGDAGERVIKPPYVSWKYWIIGLFHWRSRRKNRM
jgi:hypothetical protein